MKKYSTKRFLAILLSFVALFQLSSFGFAKNSTPYTYDELPDNDGILPDTFDPLIQFQVDGVSAYEVVPKEPVVSEEFEATLKGRDPRSAVSYNARTDEVTIDTYTAIESYGMLETAPSDIVHEDISVNATFPTDDRTEIKNVTTFPYRAVVEITAYFSGGGTLTGTGAMVGEKTVLTAGHVVYDQDYGWATKVEIVPGGVLSGYDTYAGYQFTSVIGWTQNADFEYDYAVIQLEESPGVGYFGTHAETTANLKKDSFYAYGFPDDKDDGTLWRTGSGAYLISDRRFYFDGYSTDGLSGSPVVAQDDTEYILGILSGNMATTSGKRVIVAVRITSEIVKFIKDYI